MRKKLMGLLVHRMSLWLWITAALVTFIAFKAKHMLPILVWKVALLSISAYVGYWISRALEASGKRPHELALMAEQCPDQVHAEQLEKRVAEAYARRALVVSACMIAAALGT